MSFRLLCSASNSILPLLRFDFADSVSFPVQFSRCAGLCPDPIAAAIPCHPVGRKWPPVCLDGRYWTGCARTQSPPPFLAIRSAENGLLSVLTVAIGFYLRSLANPQNDTEITCDRIPSLTLSVRPSAFAFASSRLYFSPGLTGFRPAVLRIFPILFDLGFGFNFLSAFSP